MVEDYYKQQPEKAEEMGVKMYWNDGVIDEMTELEVYKTGTKRVQGSGGGEKVVKKQKKKRKS
jgi:hypothetical protein